LQDEGKVRLIGVSNTYDVRILASLGKARKVQVVQNGWYEGNEWDQKVWGPSNLWKRLLSQMCISTRHIRRRVFLLVIFRTIGVRYHAADSRRLKKHGSLIAGLGPNPIHSRLIRGTDSLADVRGNEQTRAINYKFYGIVRNRPREKMILGYEGYTMDGGNKKRIKKA